MKQKRASLFAAPGYIEPTNSKRVVLTHTTSYKKILKNQARVVEEVNDNFKQNVSNHTPNGRSTSLNKNGPRYPTNSVNEHNSGMRCTYFGHGFYKDKKSPYDVPQATTSKIVIGSFHKTTASWNKTGNLHPQGGEAKTERRVSNGLGATQTGFAKLKKTGELQFPLIESKAAHRWKDRVELESNDPYIKAIASNKLSRANGARVLSTTKGMERGSAEETKERGRESLPEGRKVDVRTFNWEGIHFEVSPKKIDPALLGKDMQPAYAKEMNLMHYDFNNSINRNRSESPKQDLNAKESNRNALHKKTSMNFAIKEKCENDANRTTSTTANTISEERREKYHLAVSKKNSGIEEEIGSDDSSNPTAKKIANRSPRCGEPAVLLLNRGIPAANVQTGDRIKSPPSPMANNSKVL